MRRPLPLLLLLAALFAPGCGRPVTPTLAPALEFGERGRKPGQFLNIDGIAASSDEIYVADARRVQVFTAGGKFLRALGHPGRGPGEFRTEATGVALLADGGVVATDTGNFRVQIFSASGECRLAFGGRGVGDGRFLVPGGVAVDPAGRILVSDMAGGSVQAFDAEGRFLFRFAPAAPPLANPEAIACRGDRIYVADENNFRIAIFDANGRFAGAIGGHARRPLLSPDRDNGEPVPAGLFSRDVEGIAVDRDGTLYAVNEDEGRVERFAPDGRYLGGFASAAKGGFKRPQGLAVTPDGRRLLVADLANARVQAFDLAAVRTLLDPPR